MTEVASATNATEATSTPNAGFWVFHFTANTNPPLLIATLPIDDQGSFLYSAMPYEGEVATDTLDRADYALFSFAASLADGTASSSFISLETPTTTQLASNPPADVDMPS